MTKQQKDFDWNRARAFLATADSGSLTAAARLLGISQPTLGRQVAALEEELGVLLFERSHEGLNLTSAGLVLLEQARAMKEAARQLSLLASGQSQSLEGSVCISATEMMASCKLPEVLAQLRNHYPNLTLELIASSQISDLRRREADIAIRSGRPQQPDLIARKLGYETYGFFATPDYVSRLGPDLLAAATSGVLQIIGFDQYGKLIDLLQQQGLSLSRDNFRMQASHHLVNRELARQGIGIGILIDSVGHQDPALVPVLTGFQLPTTEIWLVTHQELHTSRRVRVVFDYLAAALT
jgi:DNA-binding transcriptional LysR family regulator